MRKQQRPRVFPVKPVITFVIVVVVLYSLGVYLTRTVKNLDFFKIKNVILSHQLNGDDFSYLKGRNIFNFDLNKESRLLSESYPNYDLVRLVRVMPNQLYVDFIRRKPLAYIRLSKYFYVDDKLILWDVNEDLKEFELPVISGLDQKISNPIVGREYKISELALALDVIKIVTKDTFLKKYKIDRVDLRDSSSVSLFIPVNVKEKDPSLAVGWEATEDLEVKIGQEDLKGKVNILAGLFTQLSNDLGNIKYIDLRFKEPVIKFNDAK